MKPVAVETLVSAIFGMRQLRSLAEQRQAELVKAMQECLDGLPEDEGQAVILKFGLVDGKPLTYREVGEQLECTLQQARAKVEKAVRRLRHPVYSRRLEAYKKLLCEENVEHGGTEEEPYETDRI